MIKPYLYLGDGPAEHNARYLLGIAKRMKRSVVHIPPGKKPGEKILSKQFSLIIISDYPKRNLSPEMIKEIVRQVSDGAGFLMIGGWGSFTGLDGGYHGSLIEKILPVFCKASDDRRQLASGAYFKKLRLHPVVKNIPIKISPVIIGYNEVKPKKTSKVILELYQKVSGKKAPLLILGQFNKGKTAAWTSDIAPHWCGGMVDWGGKRIKQQVTRRAAMEVGNLYVQFFSQIFRWLEKKL